MTDRTLWLWATVGFLLGATPLHRLLGRWRRP